MSLTNNKYIFSIQTWFYLTIFKIHGVNFEIRVHTPGKLASAQPKNCIEKGIDR